MTAPRRLAVLNIVALAAAFGAGSIAGGRGGVQSAGPADPITREKKRQAKAARAGKLVPKAETKRARRRARNLAAVA